MTYGQRVEEEKMFRPKLINEDRSKKIFETAGSAGNNNVKLARILIAFDFAMKLLNWDDVSFSSLLTTYQGSVDAKYHDDYKAIATIEELDYRLAKRRAGSLLAQQQAQQPTQGINNA